MGLARHPFFAVDGAGYLNLARTVLEPLGWTEQGAEADARPLTSGGGVGGSSVFLNLGGTGTVDASAMSAMLRALKPRLVTTGEPDAPVLTAERGAHNWPNATDNPWCRDGIQPACSLTLRVDLRCGGCAWPPDAMAPHANTVQVFDRYRRALALVAAAEREDDSPYEYVVRLRPDVFLLRPLPHWCAGGLSPSQVTTWGPDYIQTAPRAASLALHDAVAAYWSCNSSAWSLRGRYPEEWEALVYASVSTPRVWPRGGFGWLCVGGGYWYSVSPWFRAQERNCRPHMPAPSQHAASSGSAAGSTRSKVRPGGQLHIVRRYEE